MQTISTLFFDVEELKKEAVERFSSIVKLLLDSCSTELLIIFDLSNRGDSRQIHVSSQASHIAIELNVNALGLCPRNFNQLRIVKLGFVALRTQVHGTDTNHILSIHLWSEMCSGLDQ